MITKSTANSILNAFFGRVSTITLASTCYIGLSTTTPDSSGDNFTEPSTDAGYARTLIGNYNQSSTQVMSAASDGSISNTNNIIFFPEVTATWGAYGLYSHNGIDCPYTSIYGGTADYVKFYSNHVHTYDEHDCTQCGAYTSSHDYDRNYVWKNYTMHYASCSCGASTTQGHAVSSGAFNSGNMYAPCLLCGGQASMGFVGPNTLSDSQQRTTNGSFILPSGVIVLVDEDYEAYIAGTLEFYEVSNGTVTK